METTTRHLARDEVVRRIRAEEDELKRDFGVRTISLFGSVARDEAAPGSDVDVLVEFEKATFAGYTSGVTFEEFTGNPEKYLAVTRAFEVAGEPAKQVPPEVRARHPEIDWKGLTGFRDILAHAYFRLEAEIVWDAAMNSAPPALAHAKRLLAIAEQEGTA